MSEWTVTYMKQQLEQLEAVGLGDALVFFEADAGLENARSIYTQRIGHVADVIICGCEEIDNELIDLVVQDVAGRQT